MSRRQKRLDSLKEKKSRDTVITSIHDFIKRKRYKEANDLVNILLNENSDDDEALAISGKIAFLLGFKDFAFKQAEKAIAINDMNDDAYVLVAKCYLDKQKYNEAKENYLKANRINDSNYEVSIGMVNVCLSLKNDDEAELFGKSAVYLAPDDVNANISYADVLRQKNMFDEAEDHYRKAVLLDSKDQSAILGLGIVLYSKGLFEQAVEVYRRVPENIADNRILWNYSLSLLMTGRWQMGYRNYFCGFDAGTRKPNRVADMQKPIWKGEDLKDKTIMIWREQGVGDELLFAYFYNEVIKRAKKVIIECEPRLVDLFKKTFTEAEIRKQTCVIDEVLLDGNVKYKETVSDFDYHIPAMQIPGVLYSSDKEIPVNRVPFIKIDDEKKAKWKERISALPGLKVGIIWRSGNVARTRILEYTGVEDLKKTFGVKDVSFVNLMYAKCDDEKQYIKDNYGVSLTEWDDINLKDDFEEVMALISNLDLVISPGTTVSNMSGILNVPTILFGRVRSWTFYGKETSPMMPMIKTVVKSYWNEGNSVLDEQISKLLEQFKTTKKL